MYGLRCQWFNKIADLIKTSFISKQTKCIQLDKSLFDQTHLLEQTLVDTKLIIITWYG